MQYAAIDGSCVLGSAQPFTQNAPWRGRRCPRASDASKRMNHASRRQSTVHEIGIRACESNSSWLCTVTSLIYTASAEFKLRYASALQPLTDWPDHARHREPTDAERRASRWLPGPCPLRGGSKASGVRAPGNSKAAKRALKPFTCTGYQRRFASTWTFWSNHPIESPTSKGDRDCNCRRSRLVSQILMKFCAESEPKGSDASRPPTSSEPRSTGANPMSSMILRTSVFAAASSPE